MDKPGNNNILKKLLSTSIFENIFYFLYAYVWLMLSIAGTFLSLFVIIFVLEWMFPKDVHLLNYALTDKTFKELYENHHYHAAIFIAETDTSYANDDLENISNKDMLRDCYVHIGEYSKAEKIGREFLKLNPDMSDIPVDQIEDAKLGLDIFHVTASRDLFRLYEKMGDRQKQLEMYDTLKKYNGDPRIHKLNDLLEKCGYSLPYEEETHSDMYSLEHNLKFDVICGLYLENPNAAIDSLQSYISEVWQLPRFKASLKLTYINRLISWCLDRNNILGAQTALLNGIDIIPSINDETELDPLGEFAEYCYILHDYKNARRFMNMYMRFMNKYYSEDDLDYLLAEARFIKYKNATLDNTVDELSHCCRGLREQISKNFAGMTSEQQEYFAKKLSEPFTYALQLLNSHPTNKTLVNICFENEVFNRGLLMRSDAMLRQALAESDNKALLSDYEKYISLKRELIARDDVVGPGNFPARLYLQTKISSLEEELADGCAEFARNNYEDIDVSDIKSSLSSDGSLLTYVEIPQKSGKTMGAFLLNKQHGLLYIPLFNSKFLSILENSNALDLCEKTSSYQKIFAKLEKFIPDHSNILYSPAGVINRIPLAALYINDYNTLGEKYDFEVIANPIDISNTNDNSKLELANTKIALWGGIQYGTATSPDTLAIKTRAVLRGNSLVDLPGSNAEVKEISDILKGKVSNITSYVGFKATEQSFKMGAGKADILHISTHGFFNEDKEHELTSAMHNSGLFFANANKVWRDEYRPKYFQKNYQDGILRADEISTLKLTDCKLVVLSACETGLGEINGDEGVYGLQRAFRLAGVRYILMSLWSVPDNATEELMKRFYTNLTNGMNIDKSFIEAQNSMKHDKDKVYSIMDWGGFVLLH